MPSESFPILATKDFFEPVPRGRCELKSFSVSSVPSVVNLAV
jgi:hypothetical protein